MTKGKKFTIALAVALPMLVLGAGMAMADNVPGLNTGDGAIPNSFQASNVAEVSLPLSAGEDCTGICASGTGECDGSGVCNGSGNCDGSGNCVSGSVCDSSSNSAIGRNCGRSVASTSGCAGICTR